MEYHLRDSIGFHLNRTVNVVHAVFAKRLEPYDIAPEQFATLKIIAEDGDINQSAIAEMLGKGRPTVGRTLDALERKELVVREESTEDRRVKSVCLTAKGLSLLNTVMPMANDFNATIRSRLTPEEIDTFFHVLDTIVKATEQLNQGE